eukprot:NODE_3288_length_2059_cov_8.715321.p1 GENE.NODE_3288_length_2059_cov_8.715321~~NODE_3288_length_2059_cov_8.715321.p1  ORF type:complete len:590 (+),score=193.30 NODE_3288_length_2059_cov_8.715321:137-1771(+)
MTVEAANDGKIAAWGIHSYLQDGRVDSSVPRLPLFETPIDKVDISIEMAGVKFPNPFGLASAPCSTSAHMIRRAFEAGWGFALTKTFVLDKDMVVNVSPRIVRASNTVGHYGPNQRGFINIELVTEKTAAYWVKSIVELRADFPDRPIVASVMAARKQEDWVALVSMSVKAGANIVELNMSCPHGMHEAGMGLECGQVPDSVTEIARWCVEVAEGVPIFVKLTPNITDIALIALAAKRGGAAGVTCINTIAGVMDFDDQGGPWPRIGSAQQLSTGGMCGDQNRPITSAMIRRVYQVCGPDFAIMGTGGASSAASTIQLMRMGASIVQICSAIQNQDFTIVQDYITGLKAYLYRCGRGDFDTSKVNFQNMWHSSSKWMSKLPPQPEGAPNYGDFKRAEKKKQLEERVESSTISSNNCCSGADLTPSTAPVTAVPLKDLVGISTEKVVDHMELTRKEQVVAVIVEDLCIQCGKCYMTCNDNAYQAIMFDENHKARVITEDCTGCGLCQSVCPVPGCIQYQPMETAFHPHRGIKPTHDRWEEEGRFL